MPRDGTIRTVVRRGLVLVGWFAGLAGLLVALHRLGGGGLAGPDLTAPGTWSGWASGRTPPEAALAVVRLVGIGLAWYLVAATALGIAAHLLGGARSVELADVVTLPFVRHVVQVGLGVGFAGAVIAAAGARPLPMERIPTAADVALATESAPPPAFSAAEATPHVAPAAQNAAAPRTWVIRPGEHLWSIAESVLEQALGRRPNEAEVHPYWRALVERNRPRLPHPEAPDLVYAGLTVELPEVVPSPR